MKNFMRNILKFLLYIFIIYIVTFNIHAQTQSYNAAIGVRLGESAIGITTKLYSFSNSNFEGILSFASKSFLITGLYELNTNKNKAGLDLFYGFGGHIGFFGENGKYYVLPKQNYNNASVIGIDVIFGLDYKFNAPIIVGIDLKPFMDFYSGTAIFLDGAISIRYTF